MDSKEVRKLRCLERINKVLQEEHCKLEVGITIVGKNIIDDQVFVTALEIEEPSIVEEAPILPDVVVEPITEQPVEEVKTEGEQTNV